MSAALRARAAVVAGAGRAEIVDVDVAPPGPGEVRIEVDGCGVCGSNAPLWQGRPWFSYPRSPGEPGHEAWGHIAAVGDGVDDVGVGAAVAFLDDNAFATALTVPARLVVPLPPALAGQPFPGEALGCAFNIAERAGFAAGQTVAVVGTGFLGALLVRLATDAGARVIALSRRRSALEVALAMGATETFETADAGAAVDYVTRLTGGELCDVVIEAAGAQESLDLAGALVKVRGRLVIAGFHQDGRRTVDLQLWNWRGIDVVNAHERDDAIRLGGIRRAVDAVASGRLDPSPLYTHVSGLGDLDAAMNAMIERPDGFMKALVVT